MSPLPQPCWLVSPESSLLQRYSCIFKLGSHCLVCSNEYSGLKNAQFEYCNYKPKCINGNFAVHLFYESVQIFKRNYDKKGQNSRAEFTITFSIAASSRSQFTTSLPILLDFIILRLLSHMLLRSQGWSLTCNHLTFSIFNILYM